MRISEEQKQIILKGVIDFFGVNADVWLFGSRVDDAKKGGDIDLYIETDLIEGTFRAKLDLLGFLENFFGEQKIDILVRSRFRPMTAMSEIAKDTGILLSKKY